MGVALVLLLVVELAVGAVLLHRIVVFRRRLRALEAEVGEPVDGRPRLRSDGAFPMIAVEIRNVHELAARESWAARRFGALVPRLVEREVVAQAAARMAEQLAEQGVQADVRVIPRPAD